jgi:serine protease inhibitor
LTRNELTEDERSFVDINNDVALAMFRRVVKGSVWAASNLVFSPVSAVTSLAMLFLGARGDTSWEINELLKLDDIVSFNPHLLYKNVTESLMQNADLMTSACVKQLFIHEVLIALRHLKTRSRFYKTVSAKISG